MHEGVRQLSHLLRHEQHHLQDRTGRCAGSQCMDDGAVQCTVRVEPWQLRHSFVHIQRPEQQVEVEQMDSRAVV